ncbi:hypothetical protein CHLNCDRAFT_142109 [Chlorella variabilis]|uniref:GST N-terminal domain-containing protein n=1 Tax=Chlorella variabilis TaxID=554065 RepID=E1Z7S9_CHLVA|nr:hypothetical protein CHLNCDRAFT_142109 [Chlorella variabilis]EFN58225.1 hypothetical protein CHLNCDRAFT_142109 [Chlorella variabilis]|eukprot:XP_005850327.1 hypothetical protein CHLNCDRAFT_142109 [Chlorella variabilis]
MTASRVLFDATFGSPFAQRVQIALKEKGLDYSVRQVDLANKDDEFLAMYRAILPDPAASAKVPILRDGDIGLVESSVIVEYLEHKYPEPPLLPADPAAAAGVRLFLDAFHRQFPAAFFALLGADTPAAVEAARQKLQTVLEALDGLLLAHGSSQGGDYFAGGHYTLAEVVATTLLQRAVLVLPAHRGIDVWQLIRDAKLDRLESWLQAALARPSAAETQPDAKAVIATFAAFVAPLKQEEEAPEADKAAPAAEKPGRLARLASVMPGRKHAAPSA